MVCFVKKGPLLIVRSGNVTLNAPIARLHNDGGNVTSIQIDLHLRILRQRPPDPEATQFKDVTQGVACQKAIIG